MRELTQAGETIHAVHDMGGNRIAEYDYDATTGASTLVRQYIWMDGRPVAVVEGGQIFFIRTDHIGRPVFATNDLGAKVWEASYLPFGGVHVATGGIALRFPGQWFQAENGLHQNWMRDYDPTTGRYIQADPLGLEAGVSLYGYALQNPSRFIDPTGENPIVVVVGAIEACVASSACTAGVAAILGGGIVTQLAKDQTGVDANCPPECTPATAKFWNSLIHFRKDIRRDGTGSKAKYYVWDHGHYCEVEVYDSRGNHLGAVDGNTGEPIPGKKGEAKKNRKLKL